MQHFKKAVDIPLREVLTLYVLLFSMCENVEAMEIPAEWKDDFNWPLAYFPKINRHSKRTLANGRIRWGPDILPEVSDGEEVVDSDEQVGANDGFMDERSMTLG
jgi:hypothetical protein